MKEAILLFKRNRITVENFLKSTLQLNDFDTINEENRDSIYMLMPFLELVYMADGKYRQISDYFYKDRVDGSMKGTTKNYLFEKAKIAEGEIFVSNPYISSHSGRACVTVVHPVNSHFMVFDFNLFALLEHMKLLESNSGFNRVSKAIYGIIGFSLMMFAGILVLYAGYSFIYHLIFFGMEEVGMIFTPIIALTLGLAIFDLAKTILEQEVFYKTHSPEENVENKVLTKFLISIIIALSIESLMVVFKIALSDYSKMVNAFYLIGGVSLLIVALGVFRFFSMKECRN